MLFGKTLFVLNNCNDDSEVDEPWKEYEVNVDGADETSPDEKEDPIYVPNWPVPVGVPV